MVTGRHPLSERTLHRHADRVAVPSYDRRALTPAVVHVSVGYFHRSHQAVYLDDLARRGERHWGIVAWGCGGPNCVRRCRRRMGCTRWSPDAPERTKRELSAP